MGKKVIKFKQDVDTLLKRAYSRYDKGDFPSAMAYMVKARKLMPSDADIGLEIALLYGDMRLFEYQLKELVKLLGRSEDEAEVYKELIKCYFEMDLCDQAFSFYKEAIERGVLDDSFLDEFLEFDFATEEKTTDLRLRDRRDNSKILQLSHKLMLSGDFEFARQLMETVTPDSYQYIDATNSLAVIALSSGEIQKAIDYSLSVLELDPENVYALSHVIIAYDKLGDNEKKNEFIERLVNLELSKMGELSVAAFCMQKIRNNELSLQYLERLIRLSPYSRDYLITCAIANSNCGKKERARELIVRARNIYPDDVTIMYYAKRIVYSGESTDLEIIASIPDDVASKWLFEIEQLIKQTNLERGAFQEITPSLSQKILWALQSADWRVQALLGSFLVRYPLWEEYIRGLLIDPSYDYRSKKEFLQAILLYSKNKNFQLFITDMYVSFSPKIPLGNYPDEMRRAYWQVYTTLAFIGVNFDSSLNKVFKRAIKAYSEMPAKFKVDSRPLSALLLHRVNMKLVFKNKTDCCEVFGCDLTDFEVYNDIFPEKPDQKRKSGNA